MKAFQIECLESCSNEAGIDSFRSTQAAMRTQPWSNQASVYCPQVVPMSTSQLHQNTRSCGGTNREEGQAFRGPGSLVLVLRSAVTYYLIADFVHKCPVQLA